MKIYLLRWTETRPGNSVYSLESMMVAAANAEQAKSKLYGARPYGDIEVSEYDFNELWLGIEWRMTVKYVEKGIIDNARI